MNVTAEEYKKMYKKVSPPSPKFKDFFAAFAVGGLICMLGQLLLELYSYLGLKTEPAKTLVSVTLIFFAAFLTAAHLFDDVAKHAGAGTLVPITGFANAMVSPAIEFGREGQILGTGAKLFTIAGPVLVFGISASALYGVILWIISLF